MSSPAYARIDAWGQRHLDDLLAVGVALAEFFDAIRRHVATPASTPVETLRGHAFVTAARTAELARAEPSGDDEFDQAARQLTDRLGHACRLFERAESPGPDSDALLGEGRAETISACEAVGAIFDRMREVGFDLPEWRMPSFD